MSPLDMILEFVPDYFPEMPDKQELIIYILLGILALAAIRSLMRAVDFVFTLPLTLVYQLFRLLWHVGIWVILLPLRLLVFLLLLPARLVALGEYLGVLGVARLLVCVAVALVAATFTACSPQFTEAVCRPGRRWLGEMAAGVDHVAPIVGEVCRPGREFLAEMAARGVEGVAPMVEEMCRPGREWLEGLMEKAGDMYMGDARLEDVVRLRGE